MRRSALPGSPRAARADPIRPRIRTGLVRAWPGGARLVGRHPHCMSDRKYRQRGYQDDDRDRQRPPQSDSHGGPAQGRPERAPGAPAGARRISSEGARNPRMPGFREVARCARCGTLVDSQIFSRSKCTKCGQDLRSCAQCVHFDSGRTVRMHAADCRTRLAERCGQRLPPLLGADELGARNLVGGRQQAV